MNTMLSLTLASNVADCFVMRRRDYFAKRRIPRPEYYVDVVHASGNDKEREDAFIRINRLHKRLHLQRVGENEVSPC